MNKINENENQLENKKKYDWVRIIVWTLFLIIFLVLLELALILGVERKPPGMRTLLSSCTGNLRNLGIIITNYCTDHEGHYPQNLQVLTELVYIEVLPLCPVTDEPYKYTVNGWDDQSFTLWCPNPEKHKGRGGPKAVTESLYYEAGSGVHQWDK